MKQYVFKCNMKGNECVGINFTYLSMLPFDKHVLLHLYALLLKFISYEKWIIPNSKKDLHFLLKP
jgi:hypothetical protein